MNSSRQGFMQVIIALSIALNQISHGHTNKASSTHVLAKLSSELTEARLGAAFYMTNYLQQHDSILPS